MDMKVLSFVFSLNNITSLSDFQFCSSLQELFVRKNKIQNLKEVLWLRDLSKLRNLWLADNPCAEENARQGLNIQDEVL